MCMRFVSAWKLSWPADKMGARLAPQNLGIFRLVCPDPGLSPVWKALLYKGCIQSCEAAYAYVRQTFVELSSWA